MDGPGVAERTRARVSGAPLREGNRLELLQNGPRAFDEWVAEIERAERWVHLENFIFKAGEVGSRVGDALKAKAREGVPSRLLYDRVGSQETAAAVWRDLREAGVEVRAFNRFSPLRPLEFVLRDHRKSLVVDDAYASVGGICIADEWIARAPDTGLPYRDTAVGIRGPAVADVDEAFRDTWGLYGSPVPDEEGARIEAILPAGEEKVRVVAQEPGKMRMARVLQVIAAGAAERLWIADAYFVAGPTLNQALMSAARDGVDVRLLLPATNDVRAVSVVSRTGYRELLEAGVRIFEYGGLMMHAKTSVADGWVSRVGSTNLNVTGLVTDWELDVLVEGKAFGRRMEEMFEEDLADSREMLLASAARNRSPKPDRQVNRARPRTHRRLWPVDSSGSGSRALATAARAGGSAFTGSSAELERHERTAVAAVGGTLLGAALVGARFPRLLAWPLAAVAGLVGISGLSRALRPRSAPSYGR